MKKTMLRRIFTFCAASCMLTPVSAVFAETIDDAPAVTEITEEWETTTTTTTTCNPSMTDPINPVTDKEYYNVVVLDEETSEPFSGVNVRLEKRYYHRDEHDVVVYTGETEVFETWNTSDDNPHITACYVIEPNKPYHVFAVIEDMPEGYSWYGQETCQMIVFGYSEGTESYPAKIMLHKEKYYYYENFPITGTYSWTITMVDKVTGELIPDLDCAVINTDTDEEIYHWNTSEEQTAVVSGMEYRFDDWKMKDAMHYIVKVYNMPENYYLDYLTPSVPADYAPLLSYTVSQWEKGITERRFEFGLTNTDPAAPQVTDVTTTTAELYFDTTTTTSVTQSVTTTTTTFSSNTTTTTAAAESVTTTSASDLPQTGNNSPVRILIVCGALLLISSGAWTFIIARRKENIS